MKHIQLLKSVHHLWWRLGTEDDLNMRMGVQAGKMSPFIFPSGSLGLSRPDLASLPEADEQKKRRIDDSDNGDVSVMENHGTKEPFHGEHDDQREEIERRRIGKDGIALYALEGEDGPTELDFDGFVGDDFRKSVGEHRNEDGEEEGVAEEGKRDDEGRAENEMEVCCALDTCAVEAEPDPGIIVLVPGNYKTQRKDKRHTITTTL